jgi:hypothetical protein
MLDAIALVILVALVIGLAYIIIAIHDIPYRLARARNHPHQDAIQVAGWVSLFTLHVIWPLLWIWAMMYRPDRGWGMSQNAAGQPSDTIELTSGLEARIARLEASAANGKQ